MKSNYHLLEKSLKLFLKSEASEVEIRVVLLLVENILKSKWEERTEPLMLLWEYFYKRMNSSFFVPGTPICEVAVIGWESTLNFDKIKFRSRFHPITSFDSFRLTYHLRIFPPNTETWFWKSWKRIFGAYHSFVLEENINNSTTTIEILICLYNVECLSFSFLFFVKGLAG